jgi:ribonuclease BN (tRNA processing enzyme)
MKIKVLGSGGALLTKHGNSQFFLDSGDPDSSLLFDCGELFQWHLDKNPDFDLTKVKNVFISHMHNDHVGSLPSLGYIFKFVPPYCNIGKPTLIIKNEIAESVCKFIKLVSETLALYQLPEGVFKCGAKDFFNIKKIGNNKEYKLGKDVTILPIQTTHIAHGGDFLPSYGLMVYTNGKKILITGDTQYCPSSLIGLYNTADIILHDCETSGQDMFNKPFESGVHAHISKLILLSAEIKSKMYLYHYGNNITKENANIAIEHGFKGFLFQGDEIEV